LFATDYIEIGKVCNASNVWIDDISDEKEVEIVLGSEKSLLTPSIILLWRRVFHSLLAVLSSTGFADLLYRPQKVFCIHYDTKSKGSFKEVFYNVARCLDNVMIASKLENVQWGEYTDLEAQINCVSDLLEKQLTLYQPIKSASKCSIFVVQTFHCRLIKIITVAYLKHSMVV